MEKFDDFANKIVCTENLTKQEWLKWRQKGIGGSDIASICGINPWHSALAVYYEKVEDVKLDEEENIPAELGNYLEPFLHKKFVSWMKKNEGIEIEVFKVPYILQHPRNPIALANIDRAFRHPQKGKCVIEFKTTSERNYKDWEEDQLPDYYYLQCQWYLYVTNLQYCYLGFLIGNRKFDVKIIERNPEVIGRIVEKANDFWNNFVIPKIPPAPDASMSSKETLDLMYPKDTGGEITIYEQEYKQYLDEYEKLNLKLKEIKLGIEKCKLMLKARMGDASVAYCGDKKIIWKEQVRPEHIVKECKFRMFKILNNKGGNE